MMEMERASNFRPREWQSNDPSKQRLPLVTPWVKDDGNIREKTWAALKSLLFDAGRDMPRYYDSYPAYPCPLHPLSGNCLYILNDEHVTSRPVLHCTSCQEVFTIDHLIHRKLNCGPSRVLSILRGHGFKSVNAPEETLWDRLWIDWELTRIARDHAEDLSALGILEEWVTLPMGFIKMFKNVAGLHQRRGTRAEVRRFSYWGKIWRTSYGKIARLDMFAVVDGKWHKIMTPEFLHRKDIYAMYRGTLALDLRKVDFKQFNKRGVNRNEQSKGILQIAEARAKREVPEVPGSDEASGGQAN